MTIGAHKRKIFALILTPGSQAGQMVFDNKKRAPFALFLYSAAKNTNDCGMNLIAFTEVIVIAIL